MSNLRRIPFVLDMDDPLDAEILKALEPLLARRRASKFIRDAIGRELGYRVTAPGGKTLQKISRHNAETYSTQKVHEMNNDELLELIKSGDIPVSARKGK